MKPNSPAVDLGKSFGSVTDQRGFARPYDNPNVPNVAGGDGSDIGAVELSAAASVSGRVITPDGRGLRNATVSITDPRGVRRTVTTSSFGYYSFENIPADEAYKIAVSSRLYRFASRAVQVEDNLSNVDFVGIE